MEFPARNKRDGWKFFIMYRPFSDLNFPIPGISYNWNRSDHLRAGIGIPFFIMWRPAEDMTVTVFYFPIASVKARGTYRLSPKISAFIGYESLVKSYYLSGTDKDQDRFQDYEMRLISGLSRRFGRHAALEIGVGYAFERYFEEAENIFDTLRDRISIDPEIFLNASLSFSF